MKKQIISICFMLLLSLSIKAGNSYDIINVPALSKPPSLQELIDGTLERKTLRLENQFNIKTGKKPENMTFLYLARTNDALWIGTECKLKEQGRFAAVKRKHDDAVFLDDSIEIFISSAPNDISSYFQFCFNSVGSKYDGFNKKGSWNGEWEVVTKIKKNTWYGLAKIPFHTISFNKGELCRINFCRSAKSMKDKAQEYTAWLASGYHSPTGYMTLGKIDGKLFLENFNNKFKATALKKSELSAKEKQTLRDISTRLEKYSGMISPDKLPEVLAIMEDANVKLDKMVKHAAFKFIFED